MADRPFDANNEIAIHVDDLAGAEIIKEGEGGLYFEDPFGIVWDVVVRDSEEE